MAPYQGLGREELQRALGVKPMDKSSRFRGVSRKKGKWEAKVMVNRRWAYRELFDRQARCAASTPRCKHAAMCCDFPHCVELCVPCCATWRGAVPWQL